jgi:hypothetical protein
VTAKVERTSQRGNDDRNHARERQAERGGDFNDGPPILTSISSVPSPGRLGTGLLANAIGPWRGEIGPLSVAALEAEKGIVVALDPLGDYDRNDSVRSFTVRAPNCAAATSTCTPTACSARTRCTSSLSCSCFGAPATGSAGPR